MLSVSSHVSTAAAPFSFSWTCGPRGEALKSRENTVAERYPSLLSEQVSKSTRNYEPLRREMGQIFLQAGNPRVRLQV